MPNIVLYPTERPVYHLLWMEANVPNERYYYGKTLPTPSLNPDLPTLEREREQDRVLFQLQPMALCVSLYTLMPLFVSLLLRPVTSRMWLTPSLLSSFAAMVWDMRGFCSCLSLCGGWVHWSNRWGFLECCFTDRWLGDMSVPAVRKTD